MARTCGLRRTSSGEPSAIKGTAIKHQECGGVFEHHVHVVLGEENADALLAAIVAVSRISSMRSRGRHGRRSAHPSAAFG